MKRFYKAVSACREGNGYGVLLDTKALRTPLGVLLVAPTQALADMIVAEWASQEKEIRPFTMPATQILCTLIDKTPLERKALTDALLKYADTDLLCYRASEPPALAAAQAEAWDPWLDWFESTFDSRPEITTDLAALRQPAGYHAALDQAIAALDDARFTVLQIVAPLAGSLVLALAFVRSALGADELLKTIFVEENYKAALYNEAQYGPDPAQAKKDEALSADLQAAEAFLCAL